MYSGSDPGFHWNGLVEHAYLTSLGEIKFGAIYSILGTAMLTTIIVDATFHFQMLFFVIRTWLSFSSFADMQHALPVVIEEIYVPMFFYLCNHALMQGYIILDMCADLCTRLGSKLNYNYTQFKLADMGNYGLCCFLF